MSFKFREPKDFSSMYHDCTGPGCTFCSWRAEHPIRLNWESVFDEPDDRIVGGIQVTSSQMGDPYKALSTQQTDEYLNQFEENLLDFPPISDDLLTQVDYLIDAAITNSQTASFDSTTGTTSTTAVTAVSTTATVSRYASPKKQKYIDSIKKSSIPQKTKSCTQWAVKLWIDWAMSRNKALLAGENAFSTSINDLLNLFRKAKKPKLLRRPCCLLFLFLVELI